MARHLAEPETPAPKPSRQHQAIIEQQRLAAEQEQQFARPAGPEQEPEPEMVRIASVKVDIDAVAIEPEPVPEPKPVYVAHLLEASEFDPEVPSASERRRDRRQVALEDKVSGGHADITAGLVGSALGLAVAIISAVLMVALFFGVFPSLGEAPLAGFIVAALCIAAGVLFGSLFAGWIIPIIGERIERRLHQKLADNEQR